MVLSQQKKKITRREKENKVGEETVGEEDGKSLIHHVRVRQKWQFRVITVAGKLSDTSGLDVLFLHSLMTTCESGSLCFFRPTLALPHLISWDNKRAMMMEMRDPGNKSTCDEASANPSSHLTLVEFSPSSPSSSSSFPPLITKTMAPVGFFETLQERRSGRGTPLSAPERERERERNSWF